MDDDEAATADDQVPIRRFSRYFSWHTQKQLAREGASEDEIAKYGVADLVFAFNNGEMLKLLIKRASHLNGGKFKKAKKVEQELTRIKNESFQELIQPIYFYCTFKERVGCS